MMHKITKYRKYRQLNIEYRYRPPNGKVSLDQISISKYRKYRGFRAKYLDTTPHQYRPSTSTHPPSYEIYAIMFMLITETKCIEMYCVLLQYGKLD